MVYSLLISSQSLGVLFEYILCFIIIIVSLLAIGFIRYKTKKEMRAETVKRSCLKAKAYAEEIFGDVKYKGSHMLLGSAKLKHLSGLIADACWYAYQIVHSKKDIIFEGIATSLDSLASEISLESDDGYVPSGEYQEYLKKVIKELDETIEKLDMLISGRQG